MDVVVKKPKIDKKGVFANRNFIKGEVVLKWNPKKLSKSDADKLPQDEKHYLYKKGGIFYLMQHPERYVNHSCNANTIPKKLSDVAIRDIKRGEEITSDYGKDSSVSFVCKCGSSNCIGTIKSKEVSDKVHQSC
jgi:SET domain-containing protein